MSSYQYFSLKSHDGILPQAKIDAMQREGWTLTGVKRAPVFRGSVYRYAESRSTLAWYHQFQRPLRVKEATSCLV